MQLSKKTKPALLALVKSSNYKHTDVIRHYGNMTLQKALEVKAPSIHRLSITEGREPIIEGIAVVFCSTALYFDGELPINKAKLIVEEMLVNYEYSNLKLEDVLVICKELKEQAIYSKLTPSKILKQIADYCKRREKQAIANSINATLDEKHESNLDERMKKSIRQIDDVSKAVVNNRMYLIKYFK